MLARHGVWSLGALALGMLGCLDAPTAPRPGSGRLYRVGATSLVGLTVVDAVGDARPDLVTVARSDASIRILPADARGGFAGALAVPAEDDARRAAAGDVNGDGVPDLLVIGHDNTLNVRLGLGGERFGTVSGYSLRNHGNFLAIADLNGDAFADVVAVHDGSGNPVYVTAYLGSASGQLRPVWELGTSYFTSMGIATGDFDGDGKTDVAVAVGDPRAAALVFHGVGTGEFGTPLVLSPATPTPAVSDGTTAIAAGDLNRDGRDDLVIACYALTNQLVIRRGTTTGFTDPVMVALPSPVAVALGDVNGDGRLDAVASNLDHGSLSLVAGRGDGSFEPPVTLAAGPAPASLAVADLDGDARADVAVTDIRDHAIRVYLSPLGASPPTRSR